MVRLPQILLTVIKVLRVSRGGFCACSTAAGGLRPLHRDSPPASNHIAPARPTRQLSLALARQLSYGVIQFAEHLSGFDGTPSSTFSDASLPPTRES